MYRLAPPIDEEIADEHALFPCDRCGFWSDEDHMIFGTNWGTADGLPRWQYCRLCHAVQRITDIFWDPKYQRKALPGA